jgi:hypothetical protein
VYVAPFRNGRYWESISNVFVLLVKNLCRAGLIPRCSGPSRPLTNTSSANGHVEVSILFVVKFLSNYVTANMKDKDNCMHSG